MNWYAVVVELCDIQIFSNGVFGVDPKTGNLLKSDIENNGKHYSVAFKCCGSALHALAVQKSEQFGGTVVSVSSDFPFQIKDIVL